jgi:hypothetical protein
MWHTTPNRKQILHYEMLNRPQTWADSSDKQPEVSKMDIRFGTWNVSMLHMAGSRETISRLI